MDFNATLVSELGPFIYGKTSWLAYHDQMDKFFDEHDVWSNERKRDICVSMIGAKALNILKKLIHPQNIRDVDYETVVTKLESHFYPKMGKSQCRFKFKQRLQKKHETFFEYVVALRKLLLNCAYNDPEAQLRGQIMLGVRDEELKKQFCEASNVTLTLVFEIGLAYDDAREFHPPPHPRNHKARINRDHKCFRCKESIRKKHRGEPCPFEWSLCSHCNVKGHISVACKYKDLECNYCKGKGHIARICKRKIANDKRVRPAIPL